MLCHNKRFFGKIILFSIGFGILFFSACRKDSALIDDEQPQSIEASAKQALEESNYKDFSFGENILYLWEAKVDFDSADKDIRWLLQSGDKEGAFSLWLERVIERLQTGDFDEFGWHGFNAHPKKTGFIDYLSGVVSFEEYYQQPVENIYFYDIYRLRSIAASDPDQANWHVFIDDPEVWKPFLNVSVPENIKYNKTEYSNFECFTAFAHQFWKTRDTLYLKSGLQILGNFHENHFKKFWIDYYQKGIGDKDVKTTYRCDWRLNTNGLMEGWRAGNTIKMLAAFAKTFSETPPQNWEIVLHPVSASLDKNLVTAEILESFANILLLMPEQYVDKLLWFLQADSIINQKMTGLEALVFLQYLMHDHQRLVPLRETISSLPVSLAEKNVFNDGGLIEQSLNYNQGTVEEFESVGSFLSPEIKQKLDQYAQKFYHLKANLLSPLASLPQIGNNHQPAYPPLWTSEQEREKYFSQTEEQKVYSELFTKASESSISAPYSGYYVQRNGKDWDDSYLFFKNSRLQRGHRCTDNNGIQLTAYGRPLLVYGGPPTYSNADSDDARALSDYLGESSTWKTNTVVVDGKSQQDYRPQLLESPRQPIESAWMDNEQFTVVDGLYEGGYNGKDAPVSHLRKVYFIKEVNAWLVVDVMDRGMSEENHTYTQIWNFLPFIQNGSKSYAGFKEGEIGDDKRNRWIQTSAPQGANLSLIHDGVTGLEYLKFFGDRKSGLGWFAKGIGSADPAVDYHVKWTHQQGNVLLTWLIPHPHSKKIIIERVSSPFEKNADLVSSIRIDGVDVHYAHRLQRKDFLDFLEGEAVDHFLYVKNGDKRYGFLDQSRVSGDVDSHEKNKAIHYFEIIGEESPQIKQSFGNICPDPSNQESSAKETSFLAPLIPAFSIEEELAIGWIRSMKEFPEPLRLHDYQKHTQHSPDATEVVRGVPIPEEARKSGVVFEGYLKIETAGEYIVRISGKNDVSFSFLGIHGEEYPPVAWTKRDDYAEVSLTLEPGFYPVLLAYGFHYHFKPELQFTITHQGKNLEPDSLFYHRND